MERFEQHAGIRQTEKEEIYSKQIRAGKRTYFFDVKKTRQGELYLTVTESKRRHDNDGSMYYEKHKIFLYKEDFEKFLNGLDDVINFIDESSPMAVEDGSLQEVINGADFSAIEFDNLQP
ncbi:MAG: PUR family DNA/RNA-binding protein [Marinilabiliaceae bacterium]|nr:PUR family DNA/RNA-binding protein [Marinilabiliaceae bacterium]